MYGRTGQIFILIALRNCQYPWQLYPGIWLKIFLVGLRVTLMSQFPISSLTLHQVIWLNHLGTLLCIKVSSEMPRNFPNEAWLNWNICGIFRCTLRKKYDKILGELAKLKDLRKGPIFFNRAVRWWCHVAPPVVPPLNLACRPYNRVLTGRL